MRTSRQKSLNVLVSIFLAGIVHGGSACRSRAVDVPAASIGRPVEAPVFASSCAGNTSFLVGSGVYDITGPAAELGMMGYARIDQKTAGIHLRLRARAFVIATPCNGNRVAFVSADMGQIFQVMKQQVVAKLQTTYGQMYTDANVMLSATHTHSGPGGTSHYALYNLTIFGFDQQNLDAVVDGIYQAIVRAHNNLDPGTITVASGDLSCCQFTVQTGVVFDDKPPDQHFGSVITDANASYSRGQTGTVVFWGGHPKNNLRIQDSFLQVQLKNADGPWSVVAYDWDWETTYTWARDHCFACSHSTVQWTIPSTAAPGTYRIRHDGTWKSVSGSMHPYCGFSREFTVD